MFPSLNEADLDASVEMIAFMWVASGNDPSRVTPETGNIVRVLLAQAFRQLPPDLQMLFANGRENNRVVQATWSAADPFARAAMGQQFLQLLAVLGLVQNGTAGAQGGGESPNAAIASNIAWNASGAGDWSSR
jgi:hypothetical protein